MSAIPTECDVLILGAGLSGLTTAYHLKRLRPGWSVVVVERSGKAGGLTGDWVDHRFGPDKKLQMPMHMIFREKYKNLIALVEEIGGEISPLYKGFNIIDSLDRVHRLEMDDWASRNLPPPFHALGMFAKLGLPWSGKWDLLKLGAASAYCAVSLLSQRRLGLQEPRLAPNTMSFEDMQILLKMGAESRDFIETLTPSIYNLHPWYTSAPRMANIVAGTMMLTKDSLHYHVFAKNYNSALIDRFVDRLKEMGVDFRFWTEARRIEEDSVWVREFGPEQGGKRAVCDACGAENHVLDRAFCTRCGKDTTLDRVRDGVIAKPVASELWAATDGCARIRPKRLVTAMYPHMIARLVPAESGLRELPYVRSCFSSRGNQTQLSIGRVYFKKPVTRGAREITGTHNPSIAFNGCQSVFNNFGAEDLGWREDGDVVDVLLDVGVIRDAHSPKLQAERITRDLQRVYPDARPELVEHVSYADIRPDTLYLSEQPAIAGLHRIFDTHRVGSGRWYVCGCHSGMIGIGMESAVESALATVNCVMEDEGSSERVPIHEYIIHPGSRAAAAVGGALLWWRGGFGRVQRLAGSKYSLPAPPA